MSGSWQIPQFAETIGDAFDWWAIPAPCGPAACTGMPGGAALVAMKDTDHPAEVGKLMDFLAQEENLAEFYGKTLFIPGHLKLATGGVEFATEDPRAKHALEIDVVLVVAAIFIKVNASLSVSLASLRDPFSSMVTA